MRAQARARPSARPGEPRARLADAAEPGTSFFDRRRLAFWAIGGATGLMLGASMYVPGLSRLDATEFLAVAARAEVRTETMPYDLAQANAALSDLREGRLQGAAVLVP
jgi:hypothetical protein